MIRHVVGYGALVVCLTSIIVIMAVENTLNPTGPVQLQATAYTAFFVGFVCVGPRLRMKDSPDRFRLRLPSWRPSR